MYQNKKVSVLMSCYNESEKELKLSIKSILNQTYSNLELIVVLDNPGNQKLKIILKEFEASTNKIKLHFNKSNSGIAESLNKAYDMSLGYYLARMDADDISLPERISTQVNYIEKNKLDLIGTDIEYINEHGSILGKKKKLRKHNSIVRYLKYGRMGIVHPTFLMKREVFSKLERYESIPGAEDMDFLARAILGGFKVGNVPLNLFKCRIRSNSITKTNAHLVHLNGKSISESFNLSNDIAEYQKNLNFSPRYNNQESINHTINTLFYIYKNPLKLYRLFSRKINYPFVIHKIKGLIILHTLYYLEKI
jgi:glycosyltransferase involved in cell wall biosynthesis